MDTHLQPELIERISKVWNQHNKYELVYLQVARAPLARRVASPFFVALFGRVHHHEQHARRPLCSDGFLESIMNLW